MNFCKKSGVWLFSVLFLSNAALFASASHEPAARAPQAAESVTDRKFSDSPPAINSPLDEPETLAQAAPLTAAVQASAQAETAAEPSRAERVMKALAEAYPTRIGPAEFRDDDWAVQVYGKWFYYAEGRLLPEEIRHRFNEYAPHGFYNYPVDLPPWREPSAEESERYKAMTTNRRNTLGRSNHFYNAMLRAANRDEAYDRVKQIKLFGHPVLVHYSIMEVLALIEERLLKDAKTKPEVRQWINDIGSAESWYWRDIADSPNRSFHSYGIAIDILPKSLRGLQTYWLWASRSNLDWWKVPYTRRYHPPDAVVKVFESYGFIWGGKWAIYDTMHFEYRPEIFILNGLPLETVR